MRGDLLKRGFTQHVLAPTTEFERGKLVALTLYGTEDCVFLRGIGVPGKYFLAYSEEALDEAIKQLELEPITKSE